MRGASPPRVTRPGKPMHEPNSTLRFWLLNTIAWAAYALLNVFLMAQFGGASSGGMLIGVTLAAALWAISGVLRGRALTLHWWDDPAPALLSKLAASVVLGALLAQGVIAAVLVPALRNDWVQLPAGAADYSVGASIGYWLNTAIVLALWTGVWAGLHSMRRARQAQLAQLRAEAAHSALERDALRARLNPHFVFNALNNLRALIHEDPERAREMVTRLSRTLRHALEHNGANRVTLAEEMAVVDDYLAIEAVHYEQRLRVVKDVSADGGSALLPAMALQLLVENAIKHGIAVTPAGGELHIAAHLQDGVLHLRVENPLGVAAADTAGHGVGLAYLRAQLQGTTGRFELRREGARMQALLEVPQ